MLVKYKGCYDYQLSCGCIINELIAARGNTSMCPNHVFRVFVIRAFPKGSEDK